METIRKLKWNFLPHPPYIPKWFFFYLVDLKVTWRECSLRITMQWSQKVLGKGNKTVAKMLGKMYRSKWGLLWRITCKTGQFSLQYFSKKSVPFIFETPCIFSVEHNIIMNHIWNGRVTQQVTKPHIKSCSMWETLVTWHTSKQTALSCGRIRRQSGTYLRQLIRVFGPAEMCIIRHIVMKQKLHLFRFIAACLTTLICRPDDANQLSEISADPQAQEIPSLQTALPCGRIRKQNKLCTESKLP